MSEATENKVEIFPDVLIGVREDGSPYYAKDLAAELAESQDTVDWAQDHIFDEDAMNRVPLSLVARALVKAFRDEQQASEKK